MDQIQYLKNHDDFKEMHAPKCSFDFVKYFSSELFEILLSFILSVLNVIGSMKHESIAFACLISPDLSK